MWGRGVKVVVAVAVPLRGDVGACCHYGPGLRIRGVKAKELDASYYEGVSVCFVK